MASSGEERDVKRKRGRPHTKPSEKRRNNMVLRLTDDEKYIVEQIAEIRGTPKTMVLTDALIRYAGELKSVGYDIKTRLKK